MTIPALRKSKFTTPTSGLGVTTGGSLEGGLTRWDQQFLPFIPLRGPAPSRPKKESPAMAEATLAALQGALELASHHFSELLSFHPPRSLALTL